MNPCLALQGLLFAALTLMPAFGHSVTHPTPPPAIVEARQKMLEGNRSAAVQILKTAITAERSAVKLTELQRELDQLTKTFLTNDAQRSFELAESTRHSGRPGYLPQYEDAIKKEPLNSRVMAGYILGLIAAKNCKKAALVAGQIEDIDPAMPELHYLKFRAQVCADVTQLSPRSDSDLDSDKFAAHYRKNVRAQEQIALGKPEAALTLAREAMQLDDKFPQPYYWAFKSLYKDGLGLDEAQRYLYLCKGLSSEVRRRYTYEPELCVQTDEVEEFMRDEEAGKHETK